MTRYEKFVKESSAILSKIEELSETDSLFGHLDIIHYSETLINRSSRSIEDQSRKITRVLKELDSRGNKVAVFIKHFKRRYLIETVSRELGLFQKKIKEEWAMHESDHPGRFRGVTVKFKALSSELYHIEMRVNRLDSMERSINFAMSFFKKSIVYQSANLLIALILFPIISHYINFIMPEIKIMPQNIWYYQKVVMVLGGASGVFLASIMSSDRSPGK